MRTEDDKKAERKAQGRRLAAARLNLGLKGPKEAATLFGWSKDTYPQHENGTRGIGRAAKEYAEKFNVPEEWLMRGHNPPPWAIGAELSEEERRGEAEHFLRPWRLYRAMTPEDVADAVKVPVDVLLAWEAGRQEISDKWLRRLAKTLGTTAGAILDVDPNAVPSSLLELWLAHTEGQRRIIEVAHQLRTGTGG